MLPCDNYEHRRDRRSRSVTSHSCSALRASAHIPVVIMTSRAHHRAASAATELPAAAASTHDMVEGPDGAVNIHRIIGSD